MSDISNIIPVNVNQDNNKMNTPTSNDNSSNSENIKRDTQNVNNKVNINIKENINKEIKQG